jgi:isoleucyl-tRNA synthetase
MRGSHAAESHFPAEMYLEGSDQHRGWFQLSLLPSLGVNGVPAYKQVLTHGFAVKPDGTKVSKSDKEYVTATQEIERHGADLLRLWVCSVDYQGDMPVSPQVIKEFGDKYRKIRNTLRYLLSNLYDFDPAKHRVKADAISPRSVDGYMLQEAGKLQKSVIEAFEQYEYRQAHLAIFDFCNDTLSAFYNDAMKDRMYCDKPDSKRRRTTQTVMWDLLEMLNRLLAPLIPHTADEAFRALHKDPSASVHMKTHSDVRLDFTADADWPRVLEARAAGQKALEEAKSRGIENPLDAEVVLPDPENVLAKFNRIDLADMLKVSRVQLDPKATAVIVNDLQSEPRCERSWKRDGTVKQRTDGGWLSDRDAEAVGV